MRLTGTIATIAALLALACASCTSASRGSTPPRTMTAPHTTVGTTSRPPVSRPPVSRPPASSGSGFSGPPRPAQPTIPADVPRTGPNTKRGEKPPLMPLEATQHTPEGAKAFAAFFIKTIDWGYATTSSTYMRHYFQPQCLTCTSFAAGFDTAKSRNEHFIGGRISVRAAPFVRSSTGGRFLIAVPFAITGFERVTSKGRVMSVDGPHGHERFDVTCTWKAGGWQTIKMALET